jgi:hypothetical protein
MHEKQQLERLLDGLQGPDWLRVMGITSVTVGDIKDWESKRDYFIKEIEALVDKFRQWKQEEKRIRAEKEAALTARTEDEDDEAGEESEASEPPKVNGKTSHPKDQQPKEPEPPKPKRPPRPHGFLLPYAPPEPTTPFLSFYAKASTDTGETPRPSGSPSQTLRSTNSSCQMVTLIRSSYATMHDNADGGRGRGRVALVHQLSLSILSLVFVYTLSYGLA